MNEVERLQQQIAQLRDEADRYIAALKEIYALEFTDESPLEDFFEVRRICKNTLPAHHCNVLPEADDDATEEMPKAPEASPVEERDDSNVVRLWKLERVKEWRKGYDQLNYWWVAYTDPVVKLTLFEADAWALRECGFEIDQYAKIQEVDIEIQWFTDNRRYKAIRAVKKDGEWIDFQKKRMGFDRVIRGRAAQARYERSHRY